MDMNDQSAPNIDSFAAVIGLWANAPAFARACNAARPQHLRGELCDIEALTARAWKSRNTIPPARFEEVVSAAQKWGLKTVTLPLLNTLYKARYPDQDAGARIAAEFS